MSTTVYIDPQKPEPALETYTLLRQVNSLLDMFSRYDLRGEGLTVPQFAILNHATHEGIPLSEISARMMCDNSNLTGIVDRLISKGLVERRPDPQDRRVSLICLTQAGADKLRSIRPRHHASVSQRMYNLSQTEVQQLRDLLQALHQRLGDVLVSERNMPPADTPAVLNGNGNGNGVTSGQHPTDVLPNTSAMMTEERLQPGR